jgi:hypothetical protein
MSSPRSSNNKREMLSRRPEKVTPVQFTGEQVQAALQSYNAKKRYGMWNASKEMKKLQGLYDSLQNKSEPLNSENLVLLIQLSAIASKKTKDVLHKFVREIDLRVLAAIGSGVGSEAWVFSPALDLMFQYPEKATNIVLAKIMLSKFITTMTQSHVNCDRVIEYQNELNINPNLADDLCHLIKNESAYSLLIDEPQNIECFLQNRLPKQPPAEEKNEKSLSIKSRANKQ